MELSALDWGVVLLFSPVAPASPLPLTRIFEPVMGSLARAILLCRNYEASYQALLRSHGLNPYLGLLHDGEDRYESLVADLQEPFRVHVDRCVLRFINRGEIGPGEFTRSGERLWLARPAGRRFAQAFETMLSESPGGLCIRDALWVQVRALRATVTQGAPLWLYGWEPAASESGAAEQPDEECPDDAQSLRG